MPKIYEAIRDNLVSKGMSLPEAKKHAAMMYNAKHKDNSVTRSSK